jgi:hypothetical protein
MSIKLKRITTQFIPFEDRIRLTGADESGATLTLWLTQRLINRLVVPLCDGLDKQITPPPKKAGAPSVPSLQVHMVQTFAQQKAAAELPKGAAVVIAPQSPAWLVETVVIKNMKSSIRMTFKGLEAAQQAELTLSTFELRQWLGIVFKQYKSAAWATQVWPAWVEEASMPSAPVQPSSLH